MQDGSVSPKQPVLFDNSDPAESLGSSLNDFVVPADATKTAASNPSTTTSTSTDAENFDKELTTLELQSITPSGTQTIQSGTSRYRNIGFPMATQFYPEIEQELNWRKVNRNWQNETTPFIRVTPGYYRMDANNIYKVKIEGFASSPSENTSQFDFSRIYRPERDFRPEAGIVGLTVSHKNIFGSVRQATLKWQAQTLVDFEELAPYMMNPGKTIFIEWGWTDKGTKELKNVSDLNLNFRTDYMRMIDSILSSKGNYNSLLGIITNFEYTLNKDGSFECSTEIKSPGILLEGINSATDYRFSSYTIKRNNDYELSAEEVEKEKKKTLQYMAAKTLHDWAQSDTLYSAISKDAKNKTFSKIDDENNITGWNDVFACYIKNTEEQEKVLQEKIKSGEIDDNQSSKGRGYLYVSWGYVEDRILNYSLKLIRGEDTGARVVMFDSRQSRISTNPSALRSMNPDICIIPLVNGVKQDGKYAMPSKDSLIFPQFKNSKQETSNDPNFSTPRHILINVNFLIKCILDNEKLIDIITDVFKGINSCCWNYWEFQIKDYSAGELYKLEGSDLKVSDVIYSVTDNRYYNTDLETSKKYAYKFNMRPMSYESNNKIGVSTSIVRDVQFSSKLSNEMAMSVFYSAQKSVYSKATVGKQEKLTYQLFEDPDMKSGDSFWPDPVNVDVTTEPYGNEDVADEEDKANLKSARRERFERGWNNLPIELKKYLPIFDYKFDNVSGGYAPYFGNGVDQKKIYKKYRSEFQLMYQALFNNAGIKNDTNNQGILPIKIDLELDGISGIRIGNIFRLDYIPRMYIRNSVFQISGLSEEVNRNAWTTKITAIVRVFLPENFDAEDEGDQKVNQSYGETQEETTDLTEEWIENRDKWPVNIQLGLGVRNNNPGNLIYVKQPNSRPGHRGFAQFKSPEKGWNALLHQVELDQDKLGKTPKRNHTIRTFMHKYAPAHENPTENYIKFICRKLGVPDSTKISTIDTTKLAKLLGWYESHTIVRDDNPENWPNLS